MFEHYHNSSAKLGNIKEIIREALDTNGENLELPCYISVNHLGKELADIYIKETCCLQTPGVWRFKVKYITFEEYFLSGFEPF